jgi:hypothetical protein
MKKTIEYDSMDYGVLMLLEAHLEYLMESQPNLNSIKNTIYQMPYENGQKTLIKFLTYFREMKESLNET